MRAGLQDERLFAEQAARDDFRDVPADQLLTGLHDKQVVLVFVESYGRVALEQPTIAAEVGATLAAGDDQLATAGLRARSGYLTSATTGGGSWLAHATLLSGLWIDNQRRYRSLMASDRLTLTQAFQRSGWHTIGVMPGVTSAWPDGAFYHYDEVRRFLPPRLRRACVRLVTAARPVHTRPSGPAECRVSHPADDDRRAAGDQPRALDAGAADGGRGRARRRERLRVVGDRHPTAGVDRVRDPDRVRGDYAHSISYTLSTVVSYAAEQADEDTVLIMVGDHQPAPVVTGPDSNRDVPITIISGRSAVLARTLRLALDAGGCDSALDAPVWRMDTSATWFLTADSDGLLRELVRGQPVHARVGCTLITARRSATMARR